MKSKNQKKPKNTAEHQKSGTVPKKISAKNSDAIDELEADQQDSDSDGSYSEHLDVTPPNPHGFPTFGIAETDFVNRSNGRTTGRIVDDEPGL